MRNVGGQKQRHELIFVSRHPNYRTSHYWRTTLFLLKGFLELTGFRIIEEDLEI